MGLGQGLVGQCAIDASKILLTNVASTAFRVASGLSEGATLDVPVLPVLPVVFEGEALREVLKQEFAVILLDVNMPDIDGSRLPG